MQRNWLRNIVGGLSFTSALFIFQACYGTPQDFGLDVMVEGLVKSKTTGLPINGIRVSVKNEFQYTNTNEDGRFGFYTEKTDRLTISLQDIDASENGAYSSLDTTLVDFGENIFLDLILDEK